MTNRTSKLQLSLARNSAPQITVIGKRSRPLSKLRTIDETAELLNVSPRTVRRLVGSGALRAHHFGRLVRIEDADIAVLLAASVSV